jgi:hypothetical protein
VAWTVASASARAPKHSSESPRAGKGPPLRVRYSRLTL